MQVYHFLILGSFSSGKTQFMQSASEIDVVSTANVIEPVRIPKIFFDFARLTCSDDFCLYYFGYPGTRVFDIDAVDEYIFPEKLLGIITLIDSSKPESWGESRKIFEAVYFNYHFPLIVAANRQDHPDAWPVEDLRIALKIPEHIPLVPCVARDKESVKGVLLRLLEEVLKESEV